jgi:hypothetical protein
MFNKQWIKAVVKTKCKQYNYQKVNFLRNLEPRFKTVKRLKSRTLRIMLLSVQWTSMVLDLYNKSMMWQLLKKKSLYFQRFFQRQTI